MYAAQTRASLWREGAIEIIWRRTCAAVEKALHEGGIDIALIDLAMADGDAAALVRRVRYGEIGQNPFLPIILTTRNPQGAIIDAALAAGADDVLAKPYTASMVARRIHRLGSGRKPFIATEDYVGPVRGFTAREGADQRAFDPPNALAFLSKGDAEIQSVSPTGFKAAKDRLTSLRLEIAAKRVAAAARAALEAGAAQAPIAFRALRDSAQSLTAVAVALRSAAFKRAVGRLAALAAHGVMAGADARQVARLVAELADAVSLAAKLGQDGNLKLPTDIARRIDARYPDLRAAK